MGVEFELKFRSTEAQQQAIRMAFPGEETVFHMQTTYYDTPDGALSEKRYTLRRRMENQQAVCTLKTPAGALARGEYEVMDLSIQEAIPELCKLSGVSELEEMKDRLVAVCGARFQRRARLLTLEGCTVELALDEGVLLGGGREAALCEVEVELKTGSPVAATIFAKQLAERFGLQPEKRSKFRRALALAKGE